MKTIFNHGSWKPISEVKEQAQPHDKVVFMFTGGLDSTTQLYDLLEHTDCKFHVHHVRLHNKENRDGVEHVASTLVVDWLKQRWSNIVYTVSEYTTPFSGYFSYDIEVAAFHAAQVCYNVRPKYVVFGMTQTDDEQPGPAFQARITQAENVFRAATSNLRYPVQLSYGYDQFTKSSCLNLPEELRMLTWTCRTPKYTDNDTATRCGKCHSCKQLKYLKLWDQTPNTFTRIKNVNITI